MRRSRRRPTRSPCSSPPRETFSRKNINCGIAESLERAQPIFAAAKSTGVRVRGYISCVLGCPYEGDVDPRNGGEDRRARCARAGAYEVSLGDTIGVGTAGKTAALFALVAGVRPGRGRSPATFTTRTDRR